MAHKRKRRRPPYRTPDGQPLYEWALDMEGKAIHISQAARGTAYRCPLCRGRMIARMGDVVRYHFAHEVLAACPPEQVARLAAQRWLVQHIAESLARRQAIIGTWHCPLCQHEHTANLLADIAAVRQDVPLGEYAADVALLDANGTARTVIALHHPAPEEIAQLTHQGITTIVIDPTALPDRMTDLATLLKGAAIHGGRCTVQLESGGGALVTDIPTLRRLLVEAVSQPPFYIYGSLDYDGDLSHIFELDEHKLWLPPLLWRRAVGGLLHSISPTIQIVSQEWEQDDGSTIALYYVTVKGTHAIAARRFAPGEPVYARLDNSIFRTARITASHVARCFAEC